MSPAALALLERLPGGGRRTVAGDRGYDNRAFVRGCRERRITPHVAQFPKTRNRRSAIDGRTTRYPTTAGKTTRLLLSRGSSVVSLKCRDHIPVVRVAPTPVVPTVLLAAPTVRLARACSRRQEGAPW